MWIVVFYWSGSGGLVWANGDWAKKAAFPTQALLLAPCLSHFHIRTSGLRLRGTCPRDWWFPLEYKLYVPRQDFQPQHMLAQTLQPPCPTPPHCYQSPWGQLLATCCFVCPLLLQQSKKDLCFQFPEMETSACNFENPCQGPRLLFWSALSDMWAESPEKFKGKRPSRQTSASHKGSLPMDSFPLWNKSMRQNHESSEANSNPHSPCPGHKELGVKLKGRY